MEKKTGLLFEVSVSFISITDESFGKRVSEKIVVCSDDFSGAEKKAKEEYGYAGEALDVASIVKAQYPVILTNGGGTFYKYKYAVMSIDSVSGKEKKTTGYLLVEGDSNYDAMESFCEYMNEIAEDYKASYFGETGIVKIIE